MGNNSSNTNTYQPVPTVETEMKNQKQISLERMQSSLKVINEQIASMQNSSGLSDEQKKAMNDQKTITEKAIGLLQDPTVTFDEYKAQMGIAGGSKKSRAKKSRAKKSKRRH